MFATKDLFGRGGEVWEDNIPAVHQPVPSARISELALENAHVISPEAGKGEGRRQKPAKW
jgi:hypothetical protein